VGSVHITRIPKHGAAPMAYLVKCEVFRFVEDGETRCLQIGGKVKDCIADLALCGCSRVMEVERCIEVVGRYLGLYECGRRWRGLL
jgi:hypothetical protein